MSGASSARAMVSKPNVRRLLADNPSSDAHGRRWLKVRLTVEKNHVLHRDKTKRPKYCLHVTLWIYVVLFHMSVKDSLKAKTCF